MPGVSARGRDSSSVGPDEIVQVVDPGPGGAGEPRLLVMVLKSALAMVLQEWSGDQGRQSRAKILRADGTNLIFL
jgi:hypothetical protein